jgi:hypothetical protein
MSAGTTFHNLRLSANFLALQGTIGTAGGVCTADERIFTQSATLM